MFLKTSFLIKLFEVTTATTVVGRNQTAPFSLATIYTAEVGGTSIPEIVSFTEGGKPENPEKNPRNTGEIN